MLTFLRTLSSLVSYAAVNQCTAYKDINLTRAQLAGALGYLLTQSKKTAGFPLYQCLEINSFPWPDDTLPGVIQGDVHDRAGLVLSAG